MGFAAMKGMKYVQPPFYAHDGEDVIAHQLLKRIGIRSQTAVEFGGHDGFYKANTAYFREALGWRSIMFDLEPRSELVRRAQITAENINDVFMDHEVPEDVDIVSIDVDGNDLWIWKALQYRPSLVIIEYNPRFKPWRKRTIPYDPNRGAWDRTEYYGASAGALVALGREKGYALVASTNGNLIFSPEGLLPAMSVHQVKQRKKKEKLDLKNRKWVGYP
jgi:hypothetical protein